VSGWSGLPREKQPTGEPSQIGGVNNLPLNRIGVPGPKTARREASQGKVNAINTPLRKSGTQGVKRQRTAIKQPKQKQEGKGPGNPERFSANVQKHEKPQKREERRERKQGGKATEE